MFVVFRNLDRDRKWRKKNNFNYFFFYNEKRSTGIKFHFIQCKHILFSFRIMLVNGLIRSTREMGFFLSSLFLFRVKWFHTWSNMCCLECTLTVKYGTTFVEYAQKNFLMRHTFIQIHLIFFCCHSKSRRGRHYQQKSMQNWNLNSISFSENSI